MNILVSVAAATIVVLALLLQWYLRSRQRSALAQVTHQLHRIARNQPDHQEADQRHAERNEQQVTPAMEHGPPHYLPMVRLAGIRL